MILYEDEYSLTFLNKLKKLKKKNKKRFSLLLKKIDTILQNPLHFPMLHHNMSEFRHAHFDKSFIIIYKINKNSKKIKFEDFGHHDEFFKK